MSDADGGGVRNGSAQRLGRSKLGLLDGLGVLRLANDAAGRLHSTGVWGPVDDELDYQELARLFKPGAALTYSGKAVFEAEPEEDAHELELEVEVAGVERSGGPGAEAWPENLVSLRVNPEEPDS